MLALMSVLAAEAPKTINPVVPDDVGELFWGAISFFGLWILLRYVCLPPLMKVREERAQKAQADLEAAEAAANQAEQVRRDYDATLAEARSEAAHVVEAARAESEAKRAEAVRVAEGEVAEQRQAAMAELDEARAEALASIRSEVAELAVSAASKVVQSDLDVASNRSTVDDYVNQASGNR